MAVVIPFTLPTPLSYLHADGTTKFAQVTRIVSLYNPVPAFQWSITDWGDFVRTDDADLTRNSRKSFGFPHTQDSPGFIPSPTSGNVIPFNAYALVLPSSVNRADPSHPFTDIMSTTLLIDMSVAPIEPGFSRIRVDYVEAIGLTNQTIYLDVPYWEGWDVHPTELNEIVNFAEGAYGFLQNQISELEKEVNFLDSRMFLKGMMVSGGLTASQAIIVQAPGLGTSPPAPPSPPPPPPPSGPLYPGGDGGSCAYVYANSTPGAAVTGNGGVPTISFPTGPSNAGTILLAVLFHNCAGSEYTVNSPWALNYQNQDAANPSTGDGVAYTTYTIPVSGTAYTTNGSVSVQPFSTVPGPWSMILIPIYAFINYSFNELLENIFISTDLTANPTASGTNISTVHGGNIILVASGNTTSGAPTGAPTNNYPTGVGGSSDLGSGYDSTGTHGNRAIGGFWEHIYAGSNAASSATFAENSDHVSLIQFVLPCNDDNFVIHGFFTPNPEEKKALPNNPPDQTSETVVLASTDSYVYGGDLFTVVTNGTGKVGDYLSASGYALTTTMPMSGVGTYTATAPAYIPYNVNMPITVINNGVAQSDTIFIQFKSDPILSSITTSDGIAVGSSGEQFVLRGSNFGDDTGTVTFTPGISAHISAWGDNYIIGTVPTGAQTGDVTVNQRNHESSTFFAVKHPSVTQQLTISPGLSVLAAGETVSFNAALNGVSVTPQWSIVTADRNVGVGGTAYGWMYADGTYTAPNLTLGPLPLTIAANYQSIYGPLYAECSVVVLPSANVLSISPSSVNLAPNYATRFVLKDNGVSVDNQQVEWYVNGVAGGNDQLGTITLTGLYQAPIVKPPVKAVTISAITTIDGNLVSTHTAVRVNESQIVIPHDIDAKVVENQNHTYSLGPHQSVTSNYTYDAVDGDTFDYEGITSATGPDEGTVLYSDDGNGNVSVVFTAGGTPGVITTAQVRDLGTSSAGGGGGTGGGGHTGPRAQLGNPLWNKNSHPRSRRMTSKLGQTYTLTYTVVAPPTPTVSSVGQNCPGLAVAVSGQNWPTGIQAFIVGDAQALTFQTQPTTTDGVNYSCAVLIPATFASNSGPYTVYVSGSTGTSSQAANSQNQLVIPTSCIAAPPPPPQFSVYGATNVCHGQSTQFHAYYNGTDVTSSAAWSGNAPHGLFGTSGTTVGSNYQVSASYESVSNSANVEVVNCTPPPGPPPSGCTQVTVVPNTRTVNIPNGTQQFTCYLQADGGTAVTINANQWLVNGIAGGNSVFGTVDATGFYQAPLNSPGYSSVKVTALVTTTVDGTVQYLQGYAVVTLNPTVQFSTQCNLELASQVNIAFGDGRVGYIAPGTTMNLLPGQYWYAVYYETLDKDYQPIIDTTNFQLYTYAVYANASNISGITYNDGTTYINGDGTYSRSYAILLGICDSNTGEFQSMWDFLGTINLIQNDIPVQAPCAHGMFLDGSHQVTIEAFAEDKLKNVSLPDVTETVNRTVSMCVGEVKYINQKLDILEPIELLQLDNDENIYRSIFVSGQLSFTMKEADSLIVLLSPDESGYELSVLSVNDNLLNSSSTYILGTIINDKFVPAYSSLRINSPKKIVQATELPKSIQDIINRMKDK